MNKNVPSAKTTKRQFQTNKTRTNKTNNTTTNTKQTQRIADKLCCPSRFLLNRVVKPEPSKKQPRTNTLRETALVKPEQLVVF